jgi:hypothetical protein
MPEADRPHLHSQQPCSQRVSELMRNDHGGIKEHDQEKRQQVRRKTGPCDQHDQRRQHQPRHDAERRGREPAAR